VAGALSPDGVVKTANPHKNIIHRTKNIIPINKNITQTRNLLLRLHWNK